MTTLPSSRCGADDDQSDDDQLLGDDPDLDTSLGRDVELRRFVVPAAGRLDRVLADALPEISRTRLQQLVRDGAVRIDGAPAAAPSLKTAAGAEVEVAIPPAAPAEPMPEAIALTIAYEDDDLIVIDKPAGMVVHPAAGHHTGTLVNALLAHCGSSLSGIAGVRRPGIVHRLDKDTSGLMVVAKNDRAHTQLSLQFADHGRTGPLERAYLALTWGELPTALTIDRPLARSSRNREKIAVVGPDEGRHAVTHIASAGRWPAAAAPTIVSLVRCRLETGRTHQIRVHLASIGHPLLGDPLYGSGFNTKAALLEPRAALALGALGRQALHARLLGFAHPVTGETMRFVSEPPQDMTTLLDALGLALPAEP